jgi:hypothetical protein
MSANGTFRPTLDPEAPGLDEDTRRRRRILAKLEQMTPDELVELAKDAGILTADGQLAPRYRADAEPSVCRPKD